MEFRIGVSEYPYGKGLRFLPGILGDMMDDYYTHRRFGNNYMRENLKEIDPQGHATEVFSDWAIRYLSDMKQKQEPFFLYLAYNAPHTPIQPPQEWLEKVKSVNRHFQRSVLRLSP